MAYLQEDRSPPELWPGNIPWGDGVGHTGYVNSEGDVVRVYVPWVAREKDSDDPPGYGGILYPPKWKPPEGPPEGPPVGPPGPPVCVVGCEPEGPPMNGGEVPEPAAMGMLVGGLVMVGLGRMVGRWIRGSR